MFDKYNVRYPSLFFSFFFEQVIRYDLVWGSLRLLNREAVYEQRTLFQIR